MKKFLFLILVSAFITGCENSSEPAGASSNILTLDGKILNWQSGSGYYVSYILNTREYRTDPANSQSSILASGEFELTLSKQPDSAYFKPAASFFSAFLGSPTTLDITPADTKVAEGFIVVAKEGNVAIKNRQMYQEMETDTIKCRYVYADRNAYIHGEEQLSSGSSQSAYISYYDVQLQKGWNKIVYKEIAADTCTYQIIASSYNNKCIFYGGTEWSFL